MGRVAVSSPHRVDGKKRFLFNVLLFLGSSRLGNPCRVDGKPDAKCRKSLLAFVEAGRPVSWMESALRHCQLCSAR